MTYQQSLNEELQHPYWGQVTKALMNKSDKERDDILAFMVVYNYHYRQELPLNILYKLV